MKLNIVLALTVLLVSTTTQASLGGREAGGGGTDQALIREGKQPLKYRYPSRIGDRKQFFDSFCQYAHEGFAEIQTLLEQNNWVHPRTNEPVDQQAFIEAFEFAESYCSNPSVAFTLQANMIDEEGIPLVAKNVREDQAIFLDPYRFSAELHPTQSDALKRMVAVHELASLVGLESSDNYLVSTLTIDLEAFDEFQPKSIWASFFGKILSFIGTPRPSPAHRRYQLSCNKTIRFNGPLTHVYVDGVFGFEQVLSCDDRPSIYRIYFKGYCPKGTYKLWVKIPGQEDRTWTGKCPNGRTFDRIGKMRVLW